MRKILALALAAATVTGAFIAPVVAAASAGAAPATTARVTVRPVYADGRPSSGYEVIPLARPIKGLECGPTALAGDTGVYACSNAHGYQLPACWKSAHRTMLCLASPRARRLVRAPYVRIVRPATAARPLAPAALRLAGGNYCTWQPYWAPLDHPYHHPRWSHFYRCDQGDVYGPPTTQGLLRSSQPWRVHLVTHLRSPGERVRTVDVAGAYFAATAPGAAPRLTRTARIVVRPVHADGRPVAGYRVVDSSVRLAGCTESSSVSVDGNVYWCVPMAADAVACWKSSGHTVLCLRDPRTKVLVRMRYAGRLPKVTAAKRPLPESMLLGTGEYCTVRDGGAWDRPTGHPAWFGFFTCTTGELYGSARNDGIAHTHPWQVHLVRHVATPQQKVLLREVAIAYYVGTAA